MMAEFGPSARVYVDTNIWIYYLEASPSFWDRVDATFERVLKANGTLVTSEITLAECLVKPARMKDAAAIEQYENFFDGGTVEFVKLDGSLARRAALSCGETGLKLIDAIHHISAQEADCAYFLTADKQFKSIEGLTVVGLE